MKQKKFTLTKEQYDYLKSVESPHKIRKAPALQAGFSSAKQAKEKWEELEKIRHERRKNSYICTKETAYKKYIRKKANEIVLSVKDPAHYRIIASIGDDLIIEYEQELDWEMYAKSFKYPGTWHIYDVTIPRGGVKITYIDGVYFAYNKVRKKGFFTARYGWILKGKGCRLEAEKAVLVSNGNLFAHGENLHSAIKSLKTKIKKLKNQKKGIIQSLDTDITAKMYQDITGACTPGTNAWLENHGFTRRDRMKVRELLTVLEENAYGKKKLVQNLYDTMSNEADKKWLRMNYSHLLLL